MGADWVTCGGEVIWRSRRVGLVFPICGCCRAVWCFGRGVPVTQRIQRDWITDHVLQGRWESDRQIWSQVGGEVCRMASCGIKPQFDNQKWKESQRNLRWHLDSLKLLVKIVIWFMCLEMNNGTVVYQTAGYWCCKWPCDDMFSTFSITIHVWRAARVTKLDVYLQHNTDSSTVVYWRHLIINNLQNTVSLHPVYEFSRHSCFIEGTLGLILCCVLKTLVNQRCIISIIIVQKHLAPGLAAD